MRHGARRVGRAPAVPPATSSALPRGVKQTCVPRLLTFDRPQRYSTLLLTNANAIRIMTETRKSWSPHGRWPPLSMTRRPHARCVVEWRGTKVRRRSDRGCERCLVVECLRVMSRDCRVPDRPAGFAHTLGKISGLVTAPSRSSNLLAPLTSRRALFPRPARQVCPLRASIVRTIRGFAHRAR